MNAEWFTESEWAEHWGLLKELGDDALVWFITEGFIEPVGVEPDGEVAFGYTGAGILRGPILRVIRPLRVWRIE